LLLLATGELQPLELLPLLVELRLLLQEVDGRRMVLVDKVLLDTEEVEEDEQGESWCFSDELFAGDAKESWERQEPSDFLVALAVLQGFANLFLPTVEVTGETVLFLAAHGLRFTNFTVTCEDLSAALSFSCCFFVFNPLRVRVRTFR
jgi:hypothetical protein